MEKYKDIEFYKIIKPILLKCPFEKTKTKKHHGITRYEHSMRVAYFTYKITKLLRLNYIETTEAALLHDFFIDEVENKNPIAKLRQHPRIAVENAKKYIQLTKKQEDIITTHMFPVTFTPPKYLESWIVDFIDDVAAIYEQGKTMKQGIKTAISFVFVFLINYIKIR